MIYKVGMIDCENLYEKDGQGSCDNGGDKDDDNNNNNNNNNNDSGYDDFI